MQEIVGINEIIFEHKIRNDLSSSLDKNCAIFPV